MPSLPMISLKNKKRHYLFCGKEGEVWSVYCANGVKLTQKSWLV